MVGFQLYMSASTPINLLGMLPYMFVLLNSYILADFEMSDAQREHASVVECLTPSFAALRIKLCSHMSEGYFWKIYFLLLQPLLNEHDSEILLNPQARFFTLFG
eukprot:TRINITY_DN8403_c0_g1_i9.p1 TRINITY_DN8403_c0_g1~~TRINITY_DN8403_c0_g1_i9.p1  ORF type:complete len:104 (-),score=15.23 TRINITY_DN8403_c0_g1_i9:120-431(-)